MVVKGRAKKEAILCRFSVFRKMIAAITGSKSEKKSADIVQDFFPHTFCTIRSRSSNVLAHYHDLHFWKKKKNVTLTLL